MLTDAQAEAPRPVSGVKEEALSESPPDPVNAEASAAATPCSTRRIECLSTNGVCVSDVGVRVVFEK